MDKKSLLAVVLVMVVIMITMMIQSNMFSKNQEAASSSLQETETTAQTQQTEQLSYYSEPTNPVEEEQGAAVVASVSKNTSSEKFYFETNFYQIEFDPVGASISSLMLKDHKAADGEQIDIIFKGENGNNAFLLYWGDDYKNPVLDTFAYTVEGNKVVFSNEYKQIPEPNQKACSR